MSLLWFWMWNRRVDFSNVAVSYEKSIQDKQYYRILTATVTHLNIMHILFNMTSLISLAQQETMHGTLWYAETTILLLLVSSFFWMTITHVIVTRMNRPAFGQKLAVGYSGILFGWMTIAQLDNPEGHVEFLGYDTGIPYALSPFISLIVTQLLIPRVSFMGHLCGILAGYLIGWGILDSVRGFWIWVAFVSFVFLCYLSLKSNTQLPSWLTGCVTIHSNVSILPTADPATYVRRHLSDGVLTVDRSLDPDAVRIDVTSPARMPRVAA